MDPYINPATYCVSIDESDPQCIAPTQRGRRCSFTISPSESAEVNELQNEIQDLQAGNERNGRLSRLVLLRCCGEHHRERLEHRDSCLRSLVIRYNLALLHQPHTPSRVTRTSSPSTARSWTPSPYHARYELRPRDRNAVEPIPFALSSHRQRPIFAPYKSAPADRIDLDLTANIPGEWIISGYVYAFTWPTHPGFVKIGYTGNSVGSRLDSWSKCHPGSTLLTAKTFEYPERIERLIHLQMKDHRRVISSCAVCSRRHQEWFELPIEAVTRVFSDWHRLVERSHLYDGAGMLTTAWKARKQHFSENVTAAMLLDVLDQEDERLKEERLREKARLREMEALKEQIRLIKEEERVKEEDRLKENARLEEEKKSKEKARLEEEGRLLREEARLEEEERLVLTEKIAKLKQKAAQINSVNGADVKAQRTARRGRFTDDEMMTAYGDFMLMLALPAIQAPIATALAVELSGMSKDVVHDKTMHSANALKSTLIAG